jgi:hypothetical protein
MSLHWLFYTHPEKGNDMPTKTKASYNVKARPNLFDLAIMDGFLTGGGNAPAVQRMAYWAPEPTPTSETEDKPPLHDDLDF